MTGPADPRWQRDFERLYEPMHIRFYPSLGNHDWVLADSPAAEILYSAKSRSGRCPPTATRSSRARCSSSRSTPT